VATVPMGEDELHHEKGREGERWCSCSSLCSVKSSQCRSVLSAPPRFSSQGSKSQARSLPARHGSKYSSNSPSMPCGRAISISNSAAAAASDPHPLPR
jgi:hypothetical protein